MAKSHRFIFLILLLASIVSPTPSVFGAGATSKPNIVFLLADDLGWKDVGYHGSEIQTPNIDKLAASGLKLEGFYVMPVCSPTRASLMTGRYPIRTGLQTGVVRPWAQYGLPLSERTLAQALREAGYTTSICGKWHLGHFEREYLPTYRGFDHQYGHYNGALDYFTHLRDGGLDWHRDDQPLNEEGYTTVLIGNEAVKTIEQHDSAKPMFLYVPFNAPHAPLEALEDYLKKYENIADKKRRTYAAMVSCEDDQIGRIIAALEKRGMTGNTLVIFSSDNGGPLQSGANNGPLRAGKGTLYEGGVRVAAFAVWPGKLKAGAVTTEPLHMVDWYPTLLKLGGASLNQPLPLDGLDAWPTIAEGKPTPHKEILHNAEPTRGAIRRGNWKLVVGGGSVVGDSEDAPAPKKQKGKKKGVGREIELFNIAEDPFEKTDLSEKEPQITAELMERLAVYTKEAVPAKNQGDQPAPGFKSPKVWGEKE